MRSLLKRISGTSSFQNICDSLAEGSSYISGANTSEKAVIFSGLITGSINRGVFIAQNDLKALKYYNEFLNYFPDDTIYLPPKELLLYNVEARSHDNEYTRIRTITRILNGRYKVLVLPLRALLDVICQPARLTENTFGVSVGMDISEEAFLEKISGAGYSKVALVEGRGQFAQRGGIIDVFPVNLDDPIRFELFGDCVDSIRTFDPASQRSLENTDRADILAAREIILDQKEMKRLAGILRNEVKFVGLDSRAKLNEDIEKLEQNIYINGIDKYINHLSGDKKSILDHISAELLCIDDIDKFEENYTSMVNETNEEVKNLFYGKKITAGSAELINDLAGTVIKMDKYKILKFSSVERNLYGKSIYFDSRMIPLYKGDISMLRDDIKEWSDKDYDVFVIVSGREKGDRLAGMLDEPDRVRILTGNIENGFDLFKEKIVVISEKTIFITDKKRHEYGYKGQNTKKISAFSDIRKSDLVVHRVHGIGIYEGIEQLVVEAVKRDYIKIRYRDDGVLYIPTEQLDAIQKYIGADDKRPKLNRLGTNEWANTKKRVRESLAKLADDLVELYAKRQKIKGYGFSKDLLWQKEFEDKFPYEETEDQLICIDEIKKDMESEIPMDRILCGDVGYGKTEVAVRAMFKVVSDNFQVAYLVPTTVLAQQQYNNFVERFADYPVKIEMLSRFRTSAQQKEIVEKVKKGLVDILIATHRMLSRDISFKNLGLLVVDEEHRFGVGHKERIKTKYPHIDVLTLTATPIPRTLHMSMVGIRDISVIEMPPKERYPVQTYVMEYDIDIIRNAIYREMARNGQVFYIHNRVRDIDLIKDRLQKMIPEARIGISHGQMSERELERAMEAFGAREIDILLCTTIIESGLDISNANTIIVEDSENFGLAQLYQLKGRVGRSDRHAYAYITFRKEKVLNENAEKRLNAIREFTEFGAGFKIALRDLEIRGAGNLLGAEQHGQMDTVGYEMYCRLLEEAVLDAKGIQRARADTEIKLDIKVTAYIDDAYISDMEQKIEIYKKVAEIESEDDIRDVIDELQDRYGDVPKETLNLMDISYIKHLASASGFCSIHQGKGEIVFKYDGSDNADLRTIARLGDEFRNKLMFTPTANPYITLKCSDLGNDNVLSNIKVLLHLNNKLKNLD
jgi:transcription-repair coupling factor (superfamily II helicase)